MQWLNQIVDELVKRHPEGEILIETGSAPSGSYHLGHLRELLTADAVLLELRRRGRQARHVQFVDDLDNLRKIPVNVPGEYEKYLGYPICDIPAPDGSDRSYADYFLQGLIDACDTLGVDVEYIRAYKRWREGWFVPAIELALENIPKARKILEDVSGRRLDDAWSPIQIVEEGRLKKRPFTSIDKQAKTIQYESADGSNVTVPYDSGLVKLDWRLDFPAHWFLQHVACEPSGRDHSTKGGSVETGEHICREIYGAEPPLAVPYDFINLVGDTKKMSASKGTGIDATEGATIMPPEVVRYFVLRAPPLKRLYFDPINGVVQLMDEFATLAAKPDKTADEEQLLYICTHGQKQKTVSRVPFSHLVSSYQASLKDPVKTLEVIKRTEYAAVAEEDADIIRNELQFIDNWLQKRAPEDMKFALAEQVDPAQFNDIELAYLRKLGDKIAEAPPDADGAWFHNAIYGLKDGSGLEPQAMFAPLYRALIGKDSGPRAGWFLSILPRDWLIARLHFDNSHQTQNRTGRPDNRADAVIRSAQLTDRTAFVIEDKIINNFPNAAVGYLVVNLPAVLKPSQTDLLAGAMDALRERNVSSENLTEQPEISVWRNAFKTFGVKPSKYLSSAEALTKRALKGSPAHVNRIVDAYNAVSLKYLVPMGAMDLDKVKGNIELRYGHDGEKAQLLGMDKEIEVERTHVVYADEQQIVTWLWNHRDAAATAVTASSKQIVFFADSLLGANLSERAIRELSSYLELMGAQILSHGIVGNTKDLKENQSKPTPKSN